MWRRRVLSVVVLGLAAVGTVGPQLARAQDQPMTPALAAQVTGLTDPCWSVRYHPRIRGGSIRARATQANAWAALVPILVQIAADPTLGLDLPAPTFPPRLPADAGAQWVAAVNQRIDALLAEGRTYSPERGRQVWPILESQATATEQALLNGEPVPFGHAVLVALLHDPDVRTAWRVATEYGGYGRSTLGRLQVEYEANRLEAQGESSRGVWLTFCDQY